MDLSSSQGSYEPRGALYGSHHEMSSESGRMSVGSFNQAWAEVQPYGRHLLVHSLINNVMSRAFIPSRPLHTSETSLLSFSLLPSSLE